MREALVLVDAGLLSACRNRRAVVTYARKIDKSETRIDFTKSTREVRNHVHGLSPSPGAWFQVRMRRSRSGSRRSCARRSIEPANPARCLTIG